MLDANLIIDTLVAQNKDLGISGNEQNDLSSISITNDSNLSLPYLDEFDIGSFDRCQKVEDTPESDRTLRGGSQKDQLIGSNSNDKLYGLAGDDLLTGSQGDDILTGGTGKDILLGSQGSDHLKVGRLGATFDNLTIHDSDGGAIVSDGEHQIAIVQEVKAENLQPDSFIFGDQLDPQNASKDSLSPIVAGSLNTLQESDI
jgi:Ca2+-binding RTX toxin-like protein